MLDYVRVRYKNKNYAVLKIKNKDKILPVLIDYCDLYIIKKLDKKWNINQYGFVSCFNNLDGDIKEVTLHEVIMALRQLDKNEENLNKPIIHINRESLDNRRINLVFDTIDKKTNKNLKKKKRTITLPKDCGINKNEIPTYVWYMKPNGTHGERFMIDIGNIKWKTTSSKKLSLRYKLEEAKKYLRELKINKPELFDEYSMNGDYTKLGNKLLNSYFNVVERAGFNDIRYIINNKTNNYLKPGKQTAKERLLLRKQGNLLYKTDKRRRTISNLPPNCGIDPKSIPKYCYYKPKYRSRGDCFVVENHPKQQSKIWQTTTSKKVSINEKFNKMIEYVNNL